MAETQNEGLGLEDPDHLPWLETADDYEYDDSPSVLKIIIYIILVLALIGLAIAGYFYVQGKNNDGPTQGNGELITAQEGNYKVAPEDTQGKDFEGEGDASFAATEGQKVSATIGKEVQAEPVKSDGPIAAGTAAIQLGAFSDTASAATAWTNLSKRFGFLAEGKRKIVEGSVDGGRKIYRLQAIADDAAQANDICGKLKAAGENCLVVK